MTDVEATGRPLKAEDAAAVERYRRLCAQAAEAAGRARETKRRIREQVQRIGELEPAARTARERYHEVVVGQGAAGEGESSIQAAKQAVARAEADLMEARAELDVLANATPKLGAAVPHASETDAARREAWAAISRDLQARVPAEVQTLAAKIYTALLNYSPEAPFSAALNALCPSAPGRHECTKLAEELARDYDIPAS